MEYNLEYLSPGQRLFTVLVREDMPLCFDADLSEGAKPAFRPETVLVETFWYGSKRVGPRQQPAGPFPDPYFLDAVWKVADARYVGYVGLRREFVSPIAVREVVPEDVVVLLERIRPLR